LNCFADGFRLLLVNAISGGEIMRFKLNTGILIAVMLALPVSSAAQTAAPKARPAPQQSTQATRLLKAFVVDDRLSVLRQAADMKSQITQRLRLGRPVYIVGSSSGEAGQPKFYRVAVTRRTRGWIHASALAIPGRPGEDQRLVKLAEGATDGLDRIALCSLLTEHFKTSPLVPQALLITGGEAERVAATLSQRAAKRLATVDPKASGARLRDYYLNDAALDRFSKLRVSFDFDEAAGEYVYDGNAYRAIIKRFPASEAAKTARAKLDLVEQKLARRH
jgi:hypothetical protein